jgi:plastocyanin
MKKLFGALLIVSIITIIVSACSLGGSRATGPNAVHMGETTFKVSSITIKKGEKVTLISDDASVHIMANGTWDNMTPKPKIEAGAPTINDVQVNGYGSGTIGPFNTSGTFQIYCTVHPRMNLTVIVK